MSKAKYKNYEVCIVFVDIEDSTGIANYYSTKEHRSFLGNFHDVIKRVLGDGKWDSIKDSSYHGFIGDEFKAMIRKDGGNEAVSLGLELAVRLKFEWYLSGDNAERILGSDKEPIELNVGINYGTVFELPYPVLDPKKNDNKILLEGFPISIAKRAQDVCKESQASRIIMADRAYREYVGETHFEYDFNYRGRPPLKNLTQSISCYEYLGGDLSYLFPLDIIKKDNNKEKILKTLYEKYPINPWYASLLTHYYYSLAEKAWYASARNKLSKEGEKRYIDTYNICLKATQTIKWSNLRSLSTILLTCLDVLERWKELCNRAEQMFGADPTFADALAMKSKGQLGQYIKSKSREKTFLIDCHEEAERALTFFSDSKEYDALFIAYLMSFYYYSIEEKIRVALNSLKEAVKYVERGKIKWAYDEFHELLDDLKKDNKEKFTYLDGNSEYKKLESRIKKISA